MVALSMREAFLARQEEIEDRRETTEKLVAAAAESDRDSLLEIIQVRRLLECYAAEQASLHATDMGFACGLLGLELSDPRADRYEELSEEAGLAITYRILDYGAKHPGHYRFRLTDAFFAEAKPDSIGYPDFAAFRDENGKVGNFF